MNARPAQLEMECLKILWAQGEASVAQVRAGLQRPLAYTTVMTVLDRMCGKGLVTRHKRGRGYAYSATLNRETARAEAVRQLLSNLFDGDSRALVRYLLSGSAAPSRRTRQAEIDDELL